MEVFIQVSQFLISLSLLVVIHELGHFMFARLFKIRVEKFYLFFDPWFSIFKFKRGDTEYGMGWLPLGGYVKIAGMIDESMDKEAMALPPKNDEFRSKPAWQRLLVMIGGVTMNVILALFIYIGMSYTWGDKYIASEDLIHGCVYSDLAKEIGFQDGDQILSVDGEKILNFNKIYPTIVINQARIVEVMRNGAAVEVNISSKYTSRMLEEKGFLTPRMLFVVNEAQEGSVAANAKVQTGDVFVAVNGVETRYTDEYKRIFTEKAGQNIVVTLKRDSAGINIQKNIQIALNDTGVIGVALTPIEYITYRVQEYTFMEAIPAGLNRVGSEISSYWKQLKLIFSPETEAYKSLGGFISIGSIFPDSFDWERFWSLTAMLSIVLAVMNILPIPALDGGHVIFLLYEVIARRKPSDKFMEISQTIGMILLMLLLLAANGNDIYKFFIK